MAEVLLAGIGLSNFGMGREIRMSDLPSDANRRSAGRLEVEQQVSNTGNLRIAPDAEPSQVPAWLEQLTRRHQWTALPAHRVEPALSALDATPLPAEEAGIRWTPGGSPSGGSLFHRHVLGAPVGSR